MQTIQQDEFEKPAVPRFRNDPLVVHRFRQGQKRAIVIFIHGFQGNRYTTWGKFPRFLFDDFSKPEFSKQDAFALDLGFYEYRTGFRRLRFTRSIKLEREAAVLADIVRDLTGYRKIIFIVHSMGGILVKAAIADLVVRQDPAARAALNKIAALIMMATPQAGSVWIPWFISRITEDARVLAPLNPVLARVERVFIEHVVSRVSDFRADRILIPTWVVKAAEDMWVNDFSAGMGLTSQQQKLVHGTHTKIVKPEHGEGDGYAWVRDRVKEALSLDLSKLTDAISPESVVGCTNALRFHVGQLYEELWQAYEPALSADEGRGLEDHEANRLVKPIREFAFSGPHRRAILEAMEQLRILLGGSNSADALDSSTTEFLGEVSRYQCHIGAVSHELRTTGRVSELLRTDIDEWRKAVKRLSENVIRGATAIHASERASSGVAQDKEKAKELLDRVTLFVSTSKLVLDKLSAIRNSSSHKGELIGLLTEARQIMKALPGNLDSYRAEMSKAIGPELSEGDVYGKVQIIYEIMRQLQARLRG